jgi:hypothetical protein
VVGPTIAPWIVSIEWIMPFREKNPPAQLATMVAQANSNYEEQQWIANSGANAHITNQLENLQIQQPFQ